jgi:hypothetical protein
LTQIRGKPALVVASLGWPDASHVKVIVQPFKDGTPGILLSVDADLTGEQTIALAEKLVIPEGGSQ